MDVYSAGFLVAVVLLGGIIAFFADRLGRTLGKKRLTLFGLRPRHTAEVLTIIAGILIPLLTVVLMLAFSSDLRQVLFEGRKALTEVEQLRETRRSLSAEIDAQQESLRKTRLELGTAQKGLRDARGEVARLTEAAKKLNAQTAAMSARVVALGRKYGSLQREYSTLQRSKAALQESYSALSSARNDAERRNLQLDRENARLETQTSSLQGTIKGLRVQAEALQKEIDESRTRYQSERADLLSERTRIEGQLNQAKSDLQQAQRDLSSAQDKLDDLARQAQSLTLSSRLQPLVFSRDDELARLAVDAGMTPVQSREALTRLVRSARVEAELRGARGTRGVPVAGLTDMRRPDGRIVSPAEQEREIVSQISGVSRPLLLVATSSINAFVGEPVSIQIRWYPNLLVFARNALIAETRIEGSRSEGEIFAQISSFLGRDVRGRALELGMVPIAGKQASLGSVDEDTILKLVFAIREQGGRQRLQAVSTQDARAGDPLRIDLRLR